MGLDQSYIADLLAGIRSFWVGGTQLPRRNVLRILAGGTAADNPNYVDPVSGKTVGSTDLTIASAVSPPPFLLGTLRSTSPVGPHDFKVVDGYTVQKDGGEGVFAWDPNDSSSADDGGTIIQVTTPPTSTGRWKRIYSGPLNVKWFGAKGDNSTDDHAAIDACVTAGRVKGTPVFFPPGQYVRSTNLSLQSNDWLLGSGRTQTSIVYSGTGIAVSTTALSSSLLIRDLTITASGTCTNGVVWQSTASSQMVNVTVSGSFSEAAGKLITIAASGLNNPDDSFIDCFFTSTYAPHPVVAISSSTHGPPSIVSATGHGMPASSSGIVVIQGHHTNTYINGCTLATYVDANTLSIPVTGNGAGGASGTLWVVSGVGLLFDADTQEAGGVLAFKMVSGGCAGNGSYGVYFTTRAQSNQVGFYNVDIGDNYYGGINAERLVASTFDGCYHENFPGASSYGAGALADNGNLGSGKYATAVVIGNQTATIGSPVLASCSYHGVSFINCNFSTQYAVNGIVGHSATGQFNLTIDGCNFSAAGASNTTSASAISVAGVENLRINAYADPAIWQNFSTANGEYQTYLFEDYSINVALVQDINGLHVSGIVRRPYGGLPQFGKASVVMGDANQTLGPSKYNCEIIDCTGGLTADRNLVFPTTDQFGFTLQQGRWLVKNSTTGTALSGTATVTQGSTAVTFSAAQTIAAGTFLQFSNQLGVWYMVPVAVSGSTSVTLLTPFTGASSSGLTATPAHNIVCTIGSGFTYPVPPGAARTVYSDGVGMFGP